LREDFAIMSGRVGCGGPSSSSVYQSSQSYTFKCDEPICFNNP